jgi:hypothetical protein
MNIYGKLAEARSQFHQLKLKKSGLNQFAGWKYFNLDDFLVPGMQCMKDAGLCPVISFGLELAEMKIHDTGATDSVGVTCISITSPLSEAHMKGNQPVQNLGACESYVRRYLWMVALEISGEHDSIDAAEQVYETPAKPAVDRPPQKLATTSQLTAIQNLIKADLLSPRRKAWAEKNSATMTESHATTIIREAKEKKNAE